MTLAAAVRQVELRGWTTDNLANLDFSPEAGAVRLRASGSALRLDALLDHVFVEALGPYCSEL